MRPSRRGRRSRQVPASVFGRPGSGPSGRVVQLTQAADRLWRRLCTWGPHDELLIERLDRFRPGGYHPIHLQDELHDGQYRVIHKLGHGGFATVWLCRDQHADAPSYVAVKILVAKESERDSRGLLPIAKLRIEEQAPAHPHFCLPVSQFVSHSPSGAHICLVYPVLGPAVEDVASIFGENECGIEILQNILRQAVEALATLHSRGMCHGDFRPPNILLKLESLDGLEEEEVLLLLGEPETTKLHILKDSHPTPAIPYAPDYLVYPIESDNVNRSVISPHVEVIDFGQTFDTFQEPPPVRFGIPMDYAAPEVILDLSGSRATDLWSLGCTLYAIRLGHSLFNVPPTLGCRKIEYVAEIAPLLGKPPEPWDKYCLESAVKSEEESDGSSEEASDEESEDISGSASPNKDPSDGGDRHIEPQVERARRIQEKLAKCQVCTWEECTHPRYQHISEAEAATFADLLERLLRYRPEDRLSAQDVLQHAWFHTKY